MQRRTAGSSTSPTASGYRLNVFFLVSFITFLSFCFPSPSPGIEERVSSPRLVNHHNSLSIGETFDGEILIYRLSFWWFSHAADSVITVKQQKKGLYLISVSAETTGFIGWVTRYRKDTYRILVEEAEDGARFRLKQMEKEVNIGGRIRKGITVMDYQDRVMYWESWGGGKERKEGREVIPRGKFFDDPFTAFYNFRYGVYGAIEKGRSYTIGTFPKHGVSTMYLRLVPDSEMKDRLSKTEQTEYLADIKIDKEIFGSQTGNIEAYFTDELVPAIGIVRDMVFFGDVKGMLITSRDLHFQSVKNR